MKIVAVATARNEADIIEAFVRHNLAFCDAMIVLDHWSTDRTLTILKALQNEGLPLHVLKDRTQGYLQIVHMNKMIAMAVHDLCADWVVCLDADEIIQGEGMMALRELDPATINSCLCIPLYHYVVQPGDDRNEINPLLRITHRLPRIPSSWTNYKAIVPGHVIRNNKTSIIGGNHTFVINGFETSGVIYEGAWLNHFPSGNLVSMARK